MGHCAFYGVTNKFSRATTQALPTCPVASLQRDTGGSRGRAIQVDTGRARPRRGLLSAVEFLCKCRRTICIDARCCSPWIQGRHSWDHESQHSWDQGSILQASGRTRPSHVCQTSRFRLGGDDGARIETEAVPAGDLHRKSLARDYKFRIHIHVCDEAYRL